MQLSEFLNSVQFVRTDDDPPVIAEIEGHQVAIDGVERDTGGGPIIIVLKPGEQP